MNISTDHNSNTSSFPQKTLQSAQKAAEMAIFGKSLSQAQQLVQQIPAAEEAFKQKFRENKETKRALGVIASEETESQEESVYEIVKNLKKTLKNLAEYERKQLGL
jgi:ribosomal protein L16 Arg81 hydroxylase